MKVVLNYSALIGVSFYIDSLCSIVYKNSTSTTIYF